MADDKDIKIYVRKTDGENKEFDELSEDIRHHVSNGNKQKAIELGTQMARVTPEDKALGFKRYNFSAADLYQIRVLLTFIAEYTIDLKIHPQFLADTVNNAMYDYLKINEKGYYDNISDGAAFTFYLLAIKKSGDIAKNIGQEFAMLCGINKEEYVNFGADTFNRGLAFFSGMIDGANFKDII